jgi:hypothetical protein
VSAHAGPLPIFGPRDQLRPRRVQADITNSADEVTGAVPG